MVRSGKWSWSATWLPIVCNNLLSQVPEIRRRKPSNLLLYRKSCEVWGKNTSNMKRNRLVEAFDLWLRCIPESTNNRPWDFYRVYRSGLLGTFLVSLLYERKYLRIDLIKINCCLNVPFKIWFLYVLNSVTSELQCGSYRVFIALAERMAYLL